MMTSNPSHSRRTLQSFDPFVVMVEGMVKNDGMKPKRGVWTRL